MQNLVKLNALLQMCLQRVSRKWLRILKLVLNLSRTISIEKNSYNSLAILPRRQMIQSAKMEYLTKNSMVLSRDLSTLKKHLKLDKELRTNYSLKNEQSRKLQRLLQKQKLKKRRKPKQRQKLKQKLKLRLRLLKRKDQRMRQQKLKLLRRNKRRKRKPNRLKRKLNRSQKK